MTQAGLLCVICGRGLEVQAMACIGCQIRLGGILAEIAQLAGMLGALLEPGTGVGERVSGSREAPLPLRVDPLDLSMPVHIGAVRDEYGDQIGQPSVASVAACWVREWIETRDMRESAPAATTGALTAWLSDRVEWACRFHAAIDEFAAEMRDMLGTLRRVTGTTRGRVQFLDVPCRRCEWLALVPVAYVDRVECTHCGDLSTGDEYARWTGMLAAGVRAGSVEIDTEALLYVDEAALLAQVRPTLIRTWAARGLLRPAQRDHGRPMFRVGDVFEAERNTRVRAA